MLTLVLPLVCVLGVAIAIALGEVRKRRALVEVQPCYRSLFRHLGLIEAADFLALPAVIVNGHPDRNVGRVTLREGDEEFTAFLKREHTIPLAARVANVLAGFGFVSRCLREARTLQALQREGIGCAEWLAAGEDGRGQAFLLVREVTD